MTDAEKEISRKLDRIIKLLEDKSGVRRHPAEIDAIVQAKVIDLKNRRERRKRRHGGAATRD